MNIYIIGGEKIVTRTEHEIPQEVSDSEFINYEALRQNGEYHIREGESLLATNADASFHYTVHANRISSVVVDTRARAYHASKCQTLDDEINILRKDTLADVIEYSSSVTLISNWSKLRNSTMYSLCLNQALENKQVYDTLMATGNVYIINDENDSYWGGRVNQLGKIWMTIRSLFSQDLSQEQVQETENRPIREATDEILGIAQESPITESRAPF